MNIENLENITPELKSKKNESLKKILIGLLFIGAFGTLARSPLFFLIKFTDPTIYLITFSFMGFYFLDKTIKRKNWNGFERLYIFILIAMPLYSAIVANIYWKQPLFYGIITQQLWFYSTIAFLIFYLLKTEKITLYQLRDIILSISWIQLPVYILLGFVLDPHKFLDTSFAYCSSVKGCGWMFDIMFMSFSYFYYLIVFIKTNKWKYLIPVLVFLAYIVFEYQKRALTASLVGTTMVYFYFQVSFKKKLYYISLFTIILIFLGGIIFIIKPEIFTRFADMYSSILEVFQGEESTDQSANSRITQVVYVGLYYAKHPSSIFFGNGKWNDNWEGSPLRLYGRFYPSDLGIIGAYFIYGIFGILVVQFEYLQAMWWMRKVKEKANDAFFVALKYYLLFFYIRSIPTGGSYFYPGAGVTTVIVSLIYFYYYRENKTEKNYSLE